MVVKRKYAVTGLRPAFGEQVNKLLACMDLGIRGAFVNFGYIAEATFVEDATQDQIDRAGDAIKWAFEQEGCTDVIVYTFHGNAEEC